MVPVTSLPAPLRWDVSVTENGLPRFGYERALMYVDGELCWWTRADPLVDPGPGELSEGFAAVRSTLTGSQRAGLVFEALASCERSLHEADLLRGGAPAIRLLKVRAACVEAAMARLLYSASLADSCRPNVIGGQVLATTTP
ncbi:hypothetical protein UK12_26180 [Saccharothrix sp. ST-888]|nr:hypothetical protein UK12_26180 [Saccharothrix sp. ST-888]